LEPELYVDNDIAIIIIIIINRKFHVATEKGAHLIKFSIERIPSCLILKFWDFGRIMAIG
jgi:hypothetical protein